MEGFQGEEKHQIPFYLRISLLCTNTNMMTSIAEGRRGSTSDLVAKSESQCRSGDCYT